MFRVEWTESALNALTTIWLAAAPDLRRSITTATEAIDRRLQANALYDGESRPGGFRILFQLPLAIVFRVERFSSAAIVRSIHLVRGRRAR